MDDLKYIKKHYGEKFVHICRNLFPTLLEQEGLLASIIEKHFAHSRNLGEIIDTEENLPLFKNFIYDRATINEEKTTEATPEDVIKMFDEAGYILYPECQTEAEIQAFRHYYNRLGNGPTPIYKEGETPKYWTGEELCTFNGGRLNSCRVWFAVKKEVAQNEFAIQRADKPQRQDEYGTSVISIQWSKLGNATLSIKNRYNHSVEKPDATFSNNLDNIHPDLQNAFCSAFGIEAEENTNGLNIDDFVLGSDGKFYVANYEYNGIIYCDNNVLIFPNGEVKQFAPERYIVMDGYIVDLKNKKLQQFDNIFGLLEETPNFNIDKISLIKENDYRKLSFVLKDGTELNLTLDKRNIVRKMDSHNMTTMPRFFLNHFTHIKELDFPELTHMSMRCFRYVDSLQTLNIPKLESLGEYCFCAVDSLQTLNAPMLKFMAQNCFCSVDSLQTLNAPMLENMGENCFWQSGLKSIDLPMLETIKSSCFEHANSLEFINLPNLKKMGIMCFNHTGSLQYINLSSIDDITNSFAFCAPEIEQALLNGERIIDYITNKQNTAQINEENKQLN